ncbi:MAG: glycosyltransferase family A protein, partial [Bacteroidota bacterium]
MSTSPLVSVIIPTYNYSSVLRCAIESVLLQTMTDFELWVIGDGCTDNSEQVVSDFKDPRIFWHNLPQNTGDQSTPNNWALDHARGDYIAYLGHDDLWLPNHLAAT